MPRPIKIVNNIPAPKRKLRTHDGSGFTTKYPFRKMKKGSSFLVPKNVSLRSFRTQAIMAGYKLGFKFSVCRHGGDSRCWRVQ